jgi:hypothetical protein
MPHYKNGDKAKVGDVVKHTESTTAGITANIGPLTSITEGAETCNGTMLSALSVHESGEGPRAIAPAGFVQRWVTLKDCEKVA